MVTSVNTIAALTLAQSLVTTARGYFPKSVQNADRFSLEATCAALGTALNDISSAHSEARTDVQQQVEAALAKRLQALDMKPGSVRGLREQATFIAGACTVLQALYPNEREATRISDWVPAGWIINTLSGRSILK